jgi:hypothetical protein
MLDHLDQHGRIIANKAFVAVKQRALNEFEPLTLLRRLFVDAPTIRGAVEMTPGNVHPHDFSDA